MNIVEQNLSSISELCKLHSVKNMYLFGSVLTENSSSDSDVDLLVNFKPIDLFQYFDNYIEFKEKLEYLFRRPVDLLEEQTIKNPVLRRSIDCNKKLIYGYTN
jgi:predicted nucleotidyltransferase